MVDDQAQVASQFSSGDTLSTDSAPLTQALQRGSVFHLSEPHRNVAASLWERASVVLIWLVLFHIASSPLLFGVYTVDPYHGVSRRPAFQCPWSWPGPALASSRRAVGS